MKKYYWYFKTETILNSWPLFFMTSIMEVIGKPVIMPWNIFLTALSQATVKMTSFPDFKVKMFVLTNGNKTRSEIDLFWP